MNTFVKNLKVVTMVALLSTSIAYAQQTSTKRAKDGRLGRLKYEAMVKRNPATGKIPTGIRQKELNYVYSSKARLQPAFNARTTQIQYTQRGPHNVGGRTRALAVDSRNEDIILAGGATGGLYRSTNGGASWTLVSDPKARPGITGIAQDPTTPDTWYYITGETKSSLGGDAGGVNVVGGGVYKSANNGASWVLLANTVPQSKVDGTGNRREWQACHDIVVDPINGVVLVANQGGIYRSIDGGTTWAEVLDAKVYKQKQGFDFTHIEVVKTGERARVYYAATHSSGLNRGIFSSVDGVNWQSIVSEDINNTVFRTLRGGWERIEIAASAPADSVAWFLISNVARQYRLLRYNAKDGSWIDRSANLPKFAAPNTIFSLDTQRSYNLLLKVKPDNPDYVFVGGTNLYRSSDGFASPANLNNTGNTQLIGGYSPNATANNAVQYPIHHPDIHSMVFLNNNVVLNGNDGGVYKTMDITANPQVAAGQKPLPVAWVSLNNGYYVTQAYSVAISPNQSGDKRILVGFQDNANWITESASGTANWRLEPAGGDGTSGALTPQYEYIGTQLGKMYRRFDDKSVYVLHPKGATRQLFVNPFILDKNNQKIAYYPAGKHIWRNTDIENISPDIRDRWVRFDSIPVRDNDRIAALAISKAPANVLYFGTVKGRLYKIVNAHEGNSPAKMNISDGKGLPVGAFVSSIVVDEKDANQVLVSFSNYGVKSVFHTADGGATWTDISGNLEENPDGTGNGPSVRSVSMIHLANGQTIYYAGTSTGLYTTLVLDGSNTLWIQESASGIGNAPIGMIKTREADGLVVVGTHGSGVFSANVARYTATPVTTSYIPATGTTARSVPNALSIIFNKAVSKGEAGYVLIRRYDNDAKVDSLPVNSIHVNITGRGNDRVEISPSAFLPEKTRLYVQVTRGAFRDGTKYGFAGIQSKKIWNFTTGETFGGLAFVPRVHAFPNPATAEVAIEIDRNELRFAKVELSNNTGKLMAESMLQRNGDKLSKTLNVQSLPRGWYVVRVITPDDISTALIILK